MSPAVGRTADLREQGGVAALEEEPRSLERALGELQLGELGLTVADIDGEQLDVAAEGPSAGIIGAGLGRVGSPVHRCGPGLAARAVGAAAVVHLERVAHRLPLAERLRVGLAIALAHAPERVRAVADRRLRLLVESVEATVPCIGPGACWLHLTRSIGVASHGQTISKTLVSSSGSVTPAGPGPRSSSRKHAASVTSVARTAGHRPWSPPRRTTRCVPANSGWCARSSTSDGRLVREGERRDATRLGQPDRGSRRGPGRPSRPAGGRWRPSGAPAPRTGRRCRARRPRSPRAERRRTAPTRRSRAPVRARRPAASSPARRPSRAIPASSASSADSTIRTWTGPAACRNVPQVVATGKSRLVARNVIDRQQDDRPDGSTAGLPREREQADDRERHARAGAGR